MADLEKGITQNGSGYAGKSWNILGQVYFPKAVCELTFAFETNSLRFSSESHGRDHRSVGFNLTALDHQFAVGPRQTRS